MSLGRSHGSALPHSGLITTPLFSDLPNHNAPKSQDAEEYSLPAFGAGSRLILGKPIPEFTKYHQDISKLTVGSPRFEDPLQLVPLEASLSDGEPSLAARGTSC